MTPEPEPPPPLIGLDLAKQHLRITDSDHDTDVSYKLSEATAIIRDYLKDRADPTWTSDTVPRHIVSAVLMMLTHLYEHRGDDMVPTTTGSTPDEDVWNAIDRVLKRSRDPALA